MSTPSLARAEDALDRIVLYPSDAPDDIGAEAARAAVSAALHDPDDPDALARLLHECVGPAVGRAGTPWGELAPIRQDDYRRVADAVRAAILGEA